MKKKIINSYFFLILKSICCALGDDLRQMSTVFFIEGDFHKYESDCVEKLGLNKFT